MVINRTKATEVSIQAVSPESNSSSANEAVGKPKRITVSNTTGKIWTNLRANRHDIVFILLLPSSVQRKVKCGTFPWNRIDKES